MTIVLNQKLCGGWRAIGVIGHRNCQNSRRLWRISSVQNHLRSGQSGQLYFQQIIKSQKTLFYSSGRRWLRVHIHSWTRTSQGGVLYILDSVTTPTPAANIASSCWQHLRSLDLADPSSGKTGRIDALIGTGVWGAIIKESIVWGSVIKTFAQSTRLGWIVFGSAAIDHSIPTSVCSLKANVDH